MSYNQDESYYIAIPPNKRPVLTLDTSIVQVSCSCYIIIIYELITIESFIMIMSSPEYIYIYYMMVMKEDVVDDDNVAYDDNGDDDVCCTSNRQVVM